MSLNLIVKLADYYGIELEYNQSALVNGIACAKDGEAVSKEIFADALWLESESFDAGDVVPKIIFLKNKGAIFAAGAEDEILATL